MEQSVIIDLNKLDASLKEQVMNVMKKTREEQVIELLGEPKIVTKKGREGVFYRYQKPQGTSADIISKDRSTVIAKAYELFFGNAKAGRMTVRDVFDTWIEERRTTVCSGTYKHDLADWNKIKDLPIIDRPIKELKPSHLIHSIEQVCGDHQISKEALGNILTLFRHIWDQAIYLDEVEVNIPQALNKKKFKVKQPKSAEEKLDEVYTPEEMSTLREYLWGKKRDIYDQAILLQSYAGIRVAELRALTWEDYNPETNTISITHIIRKVIKDGKMSVDEDVAHTKGYASQGRRSVQLPSVCRMIIEEMRMVNGDKRYIFNSGGKYPINGNRINEHLRDICSKLGIRYFSNHKFRFRWVSDCYEAGVEEERIQNSVGHSGAEMTRHYNRSRVRPLTQEEVDAITAGAFTNVHYK